MEEEVSFGNGAIKWGSHFLNQFVSSHIIPNKFHIY